MGDSAADDHADQCRSCPVCLVLQAIDDIRPEVRTHLAAAGRELLLALRAAVADHDGGSARSADDVWADDRCGRSPDVCSNDDSAHQHSPAATPLRRIVVE
jgi:hypothetical protein